MWTHTLIRWTFCLLTTLCGSGLVFSQIAFDEAREDLGVRHKLSEGTVGAGVSVFDFTGDGLDDLTLGQTGGGLSFYTNNGEGFDRISPLVNNQEYIKQINWVDYDNDGDSDLYVAANDGISRLYQNMGDLQFVDVTEESGLPLNIHFGYGACWGDYNRDGWLDLYYASKGVIGDPDAIRSYNRLFKNNSDGTFTERTEESGTADDDKLPFCAAFLDYNNDMWPDIYIANDKLTFNTLLENSKDGTFLDVSQQTGADARMNAMCVNPGDYNQDGWMDIYVTNTPIGSQLLRNSGVQNQAGFIQYRNVAEDLQAHFPGGNCWGSNFLDADNDGDLDLYISSSIDQPRETSSIFYENIEGTSFDVPFIEGFMGDTTQSYTNAIGDFDNDGLIDIVVQNNPPYDFYLWKNKTVTTNHWLKVDLEGVKSNRDGVGVRIESYVAEGYQMQFTLCGSGFLGQNSSYKHIGLGASDVLDTLVVTWPTGHVDRFYNLASNQVFKVVEGSSANGEINVSSDVTIVERRLPTATKRIDQTSVQLFPNPGANKFSITTEEKIRRLEIVDVNGMTVLQCNEPRQHEVDASYLPEGIYFVRVLFDNDNSTIVKWIKL